MADEQVDAAGVDPIVGVWQLVGFERVTNGESVPMAEVQGHFVYSADGLFSEAFRIVDAAGCERTVIYAGRYEHGEAGTLFHIPLHHPDPTQVGQRLQRGIAVTSDTYILTSGTPESFVRLTATRLS